MNAANINESETVSRIIARVGSVAAVLVLGIGFATDERLSWNAISSNWPVIAAVGIVFVGYAMAWVRRYEVLGSAIALLAVLFIAVFNYESIAKLPDYFPLALAIPAALHLIAVGIHRYKRQPSGSAT